MAEMEDFWKCPKHPSRRHRVGICATCLRDRLLLLCPNCANTPPCPCSDSTSSSSPASSVASSIGSIGRVSSLIDSEPSFRRSRSTAAPFLSSRFNDRCIVDNHVPPHVPNRKSTSSSVWSSVFNLFKSEERVDVKTASFGTMRSKSVSVWRASLENGKGVKGSLGNNNSNKGWHFPSPMKVFRQSKPQSPLYRG